MNLATEIQKLIQSGENETLEFKIVAFANTSGGKVINQRPATSSLPMSAKASVLLKNTDQEYDGLLNILRRTVCHDPTSGMFPMVF